MGIALTAQSSDINKGYAFTAGEQNVTHTKLNNLVDLATINTTFLTDKTASTAPLAADLFLMYSPSVTDWRKITYQNLLFGNTAFITDQTEDTAPALNDFALTYDVSAGTFKKVQLGSV